LSSFRLAFFALLLGAVGIGFAPVLVRLSDTAPVASAFWRLFLSLPVLWIWMLAEPKRNQAANRPSPSDLWPLALAGLFFTADLAVWHWSIRLTSVANATLFANFAPLYVTLAAWLLFAERASRVFVGGLLLAMAGAVLLMAESLNFGPATLLGDGLGQLTAIFYAGYILSVGRLRARFSTATLMAWSGLFSTLGLFLIALLMGEDFMPGSAQGWAALAAMALVSHVGGQSLIAYGLAHLPPAFGSVTLLLQPVIAAFLAWGILAEPLSPLKGLGGLVVLLGIALARRGVAAK
jgi:drug/metabolite transporter (DMT)-like permease